jgi:hypothetical protein
VLRTNRRNVHLLVAVLVVAASITAAIWIAARPSDDSQSRRGAVPSSGVPSVLSARFVGLPLAGHDHDVLVGIGARRGGPVDVVVIPSDGKEVRPEGVQVSLGERARSISGSPAISCGTRCLRYPLRVLSGRRSFVNVVVSRPGKAEARVRLALPARLPPLAEGLFRRARTRMLRLDSYAMDETLGSGLSKPLISRWSFQAPDRMRYVIPGGSKAVVIGNQRWDWLDGRWERSESSRLRVPAFPWEQARGARLLGEARLGKARVALVALLKPGVDFPTWFELDVGRDGGVLRTRMLTTGHFMVDTYRAFDAGVRVVPPK